MAKKILEDERIDQRIKDVFGQIDMDSAMTHFSSGFGGFTGALARQAWFPLRMLHLIFICPQAVVCGGINGGIKLEA